MKSKIAIVFFAISIITRAQLSHNYAYGFGGSGQDDAQSTIVDSQGNTYVGGFFSNTVDFYPGLPSFTLQSQGTDDAYIVKYDPAGNFLNAVSFSNNLNCKIFGLTTDSQDNLYVTGAFTGAVDFEPGPGVTQLTAGGYYDIFIVKLNSSLALRWAYRIGHTTYDDYGYAISCDKNDNVLVTGYFQGTAVDFDPASATQYTMSSQSGKDVFVLKLDSAATFKWALDLGGPGTQVHDVGQTIKTDASNNVIVGGSFSGTIDFVPGIGTYNLTSPGGTDGFVAKYTSTGNFVWAKSISSPGLDACYGVAIDANNDIYCSGSFMSTVSFDQSVSSATLLTNGSEDGFLSKYSSGGNSLWAYSIGGASTEHSRAVCVLGSTVTVGGNFSSLLVDFDPGPGTNTIITNGGHDVFISQFSSGGTYLGTYTYGGNNHDYLYSVNTNTLGDIYACGTYTYSVDFDSGPSTNLYTSNGVNDAYLIKLNESAVGIKELSNGWASIIVYPNPTFDKVKITSEYFINNVEIIDATTKLIRSEMSNSNKIELDISSLSQGLYFLKVTSMKSTQYIKLIKE